jgi:hypothetical protein
MMGVQETPARLPGGQGPGSIPANLRHPTERRHNGRGDTDLSRQQIGLRRL